MLIERLYRRCLALYPAEFRDEYARELSLTFADRWREERSIRTCLEAVGGILEEAPKEHCHMIFKDLQYALRVLRKDKTVTLAALAILALGIGATTLVFSLANGLLLRPLPYADPARLVAIEEYSPRDVNEYGQISYLNFLDYAARARLVEDCGIWGEGHATLRGEGGAETVTAGFVSSGVFRALGVGPLLGRTFTPEETTHGGPKTLILGEELWTRRYARDPQIVGRSIDFADGKRTVVGIMPDTFHFPERADLWVPLQEDPAESRRTDRFGTGLARLKPGVTAAQATAEAQAILEQIFRQYPAADNRFKARVSPLQNFEGHAYRRQVIALLIAVGLLLAIACANVSNLLLVKASARGREMAVRLALGASRHRLVRQLASESLLLGLAGGALGTALAYTGLPALLSLVPASLPRWMQFSIDGRVLFFALAVSLVTSLTFGLVPAFGSSAVDLSNAIKEGARGASGARHKLLRHALVVGEVALSVILLAGAGLTVRSFLALRSQNLGYQPDHVLSLDVIYPYDRYHEGSKSHGLIRRLTGEVDAIPGVGSSTFTTGVPLSGDSWTRMYTIQGRPRALKDMPWANHVVVVPGYFATLGIQLVAGRDFSEADFADGHNLIVTQAFAHANWPGESAVGKHVRFGPPDRNEPWNTVVGVAADSRHEKLKTAGRPVVYLTYSADVTPQTMLVRASGDPAQMTAAIRARIRGIDPDIALYNIVTLPQLIERAQWQDRILAVLFLGFAVLALTLASIGLYAALSFTVSLHKREIGIRMALGASASSVRAMLLRQGMTLTLAGLAIGLAGSLLLTRLLQSQLFAISPHDPVTYAVTPLVLLSVAMLAAYLPARRATRVDPVTVLRCE